MTVVKCYTLQEAAEILSISLSTMYSLIKSGKLKAVRIANRYRITETELERVQTEGTASNS